VGNVCRNGPRDVAVRRLFVSSLQGRLTLSKRETMLKNTCFGCLFDVGGEVSGFQVG